MGLFNVVKNGHNGSKNGNRGKNGKYVNFDMSQFNQVYRPTAPNNINNINNNGNAEQYNTNNYPSNNYVDNNYNDNNYSDNSYNESNYSSNYNNDNHITMPKGANIQKNVANTETEIANDANTQEERLDPLNNANNPIPVNPVAPLQEEFVEQDIDIKNVKANLFSLLSMIIGMSLRPGTTIISNAKKYRSASKAYMITAWITIVSLVVCFIVRLLVGSFVRTSNVVTGVSKLQFNPAFLFQSANYVEYLTIALVTSGIAICVASLVYYSSSFLNSKGVPMGSYVMISNLSMLPLILGVVVLYPIGSIFTRYLGVAAVIFSFLYTLIAFFLGMNRILTFKNVDHQIIYNVLNISAILMIMILIIIVLIRADILSMPDMIL